MWSSPRTVACLCITGELTRPTIWRRRDAGQLKGEAASREERAREPSAGPGGADSNSPAQARSFPAGTARFIARRGIGARPACLSTPLPRAAPTHGRRASRDPHEYVPPRGARSGGDEAGPCRALPVVPAVGHAEREDAAGTKQASRTFERRGGREAGRRCSTRRRSRKDLHQRPLRVLERRRDDA